MHPRGVPYQIADEHGGARGGRRGTHGAASHVGGGHRTVDSASLRRRVVRDVRATARRCASGSPGESSAAASSAPRAAAAFSNPPVENERGRACPPRRPRALAHLAE